MLVVLILLSIVSLARSAPMPQASESASDPSPTPSASSGSGSELPMIRATEECSITHTPVGAIEQTTKDAGPNGHIDWLNCGVRKESPESKWTPVHVNETDIAPISIEDMYSRFSECAQHRDVFHSAAQETGIKEQFLVAFGMQESNCNAHIGRRSLRRSLRREKREIGIMQITREKCDGRGDDACADPSFNIPRAARYFRDTLKEVDGNILEAVGRYNGWSREMSYNSAIKAGENPGTCRQQNNLDYLHQWFNGWIRGINAYSAQLKMGTYDNLAKCG